MNLESDLELMVIQDMWDNGYDPTVYSDVLEYWENRLS
jgi:hypothetical protein